MKTLHLFLTMLLIGSLTFGGAYTMIPAIKGTVVDKMHWISPQEFGYAIAVGQLTPGPLSILVAFLGWKIAGFFGALVATFGIFFPAFVSVILVVNFYDRLKRNPRMKGAMTAMQPAIGALLIAVVVDFTRTLFGTGVASYALGLCSFALMAFTSLNPGWLFLGCMLVGYWLHHG